MSSLTPDFPPASPLRSCLMMLPECGERRPQTREGERRGEQRLSISQSAFPEGAGTRSRYESADRAFSAEGVSIRRQI